jgi:trimeric autotransporter adhesin
MERRRIASLACFRSSTILRSGLLSLTVFLTAHGQAVGQGFDRTLPTAVVDRYFVSQGQPSTSGVNGVLAMVPRWAPRASGGVQTTSSGVQSGSLRFFIPAIQYDNSLVFFDLRGQFGSGSARQGSVGIGYRQILPNGVFGREAIVGLNAFVDVLESQNDETYVQGSLGAELITERFDLFANYYLSGEDANTLTNQALSGVIVQGAQIVNQSGTRSSVERSYSGLDLAASLKFPLSDDTLFRLNGGYYNFGENGDRFEGGSIGLGVDFDNPFGIDGGRFSIGAEHRDDSRRGGDTVAFLRLDIPLGQRGRRGGSDRSLTDLNREITRGAQRRDWIFTDLEEVDNVTATQLTDVGSGEGLNAYFVAAADLGVGDCTSDAAACTFAGAQADAEAGAGDIFIVVDGAGAIGSVLTLGADRQQLVGGGDTGAATVQLSDAAASVLTLSGLGGRPTIAGVDVGSFGGVTVSGVSTSGPTALSATGFTEDLMIDNLQTNGGGINLVGSSGATATISNSTLNGGAGAALTASSTTAGGLLLNVSDTTASTTGAGPAIDVSGANAGDLVVTGFADNTVTGTGGVSFDNVTFDADGNPGNGISQVSGGNLTIGSVGSPVTGVGLNLNEVLGDLAFGTLNITNTGGAGLFVRDDAGKLGSFALSNTSGTINTTGGTAVDIDPVTLNMTLDAVNASGGAHGVLLDTVTGTFNVTGGAITGTTTAGLAITNSDINVNFGATITNTVGQSFSFTDNSGGTVNVTGAIADTGSGIDISDNSGGTVTVSDADIGTVGDPMTTSALTVATNIGGSFTFTQFDSVSVGGNAVSIVNNTAGASIAITDGTIIQDNGSGAPVAGDALRVTGGAATVDIGADIIKSGDDGAAVVVDSTGGTTTISGTITQTGAAPGGILVQNSTGGAVNFTGSAIALTGSGINLVNNAGAVSFETGTSVQITDRPGNGISLSGNAGSVSFGGPVSIDMGTDTNAAGIDVSGNNGAISFDAVTITDVGAGVNQTGIDFSGATLNGAFTAASVAISGPASSTSSVGVDLTGLTGNQTVALGEQVAGGASSSITDLHRGVVIDATAAVQFTFGDGESATDTGSSIDVNGLAGSFTVDAGGGTLGSSTFNFLDVVIGAGDVAHFPVAPTAPVFVSTAGGTITAGTNGLSADVVTISVADAEALADTDQTFVFVGDAGGAIDMSGGGTDGFTLDAGQNIIGFGGSTPISFGLIQPVNITGNLGPVGGTLTGNAVTASNSVALADSVLILVGADGSMVGGFDIDGSGLGGFAVDIGGITTTLTLADIAVTNVETGTNGLSVSNSSGDLAFNNVDISGNGGIASISNNSGNVTFDANSTLNSTTGATTGLTVTGQSAGTVAFNGDVTVNASSTALGVNLTSNTGGTISFAGDLDIDTVGGTGFTATGGGTISVTGTAASVTSTAGQAVNLNGMTAGITFTDVSSTGGTSGIALVGTAGAFQVSGATNVSAPTSQGIVILSSSVDASFNGTTNVENAALDGVSLVNNTGNIGFANLTIVDPVGRGLDIRDAQGDVTIGGGSYTNSGPGTGFPVLIQNQAASSTISFTDFDITVTAPSNANPDVFTIQNAAGTINVTGGTWQATSRDRIVDISSGSAMIAIGATILGAGAAGSTANTVEISNVTGGSVTFTGPITQSGNGSAVEMRGNTGGTFDFQGWVSATDVTNTDTPIDLTNNGGATITFSGGIDLTTGAATGFNASGGGTINLSGTTASVTTTAGTGVSLDGVTANTTFTSIDAAGGANGVSLNDVSGSFAVTGTTTINGSMGAGISLTSTGAAVSFGQTSITNPGTSGVDLNGTISGTVSFADLNIALQADNTVGIDANGAILNANVTATDFDLTSTSATGTIGVDLSGTTGTGTIRLGDTDVNGESASIAGVNEGILFSATTNTTLVFGDGELITDAGSSITATTAIAGTLPTNGSYNFLDVGVLTGNTSGLSGPSVFFASQTAQGTGDGSSVANAGTLTAAGAAANIDAVILVDTDLDTNVETVTLGATGFLLDDGQVIVSLAGGGSIDLTTLGVTAAGAPASFQFNPTVVSGGSTVSVSVAEVDSAHLLVTSADGAGTIQFAGAGAVSGLTVANTGAGNGIDVDVSSAQPVILSNNTVTTNTGTAFFINTGGSLTVTGSGNTAVATSGSGLFMGSVTIGAAGLGFDSITSTNAAGRGINLISLTGGTLSIETATITTPSDRGVFISGGSASYNIGTGAGGLVIDGAGTTGLEISSTTGGTINVGTGASSGGVQIGVSTAVGEQAILVRDAAGTINIGNSTTQSVLAGGATSTLAQAVRLIGNSADITMTSLDINQAGTSSSGTGLAASTNTGSFTLNGSNTIDGFGGEGLLIVGSDASISNVTIGASLGANTDGFRVIDSGQAIEVSLDNVTIADATGQGIVVDGSGAGSVTITSFSNNTVIDAGAGGVLFNDVTFDSDRGTVGNQTVAFGTLTIGTLGDRVEGPGVRFFDPTGDVSIATLNVFNNGSTGFLVDTKGGGTTFNLNTGAGVVDTTNGTALFLDPLTGGVTLSSVSSTGAGTNGGVFIDQFDADGGAGDTALSIGTLNISGSSGTGLQIQDSTGIFTFGNTTIDNRSSTGGAVAISQAAGDATTVSFTGNLDIDVNDSTGFSAVRGAGTSLAVNVAAAGSATITSFGNGSALNIDGVALDASFDTINGVVSVLSSNSMVRVANSTGTLSIGGGTIIVSGARQAFDLSGNNMTFSAGNVVESFGATGFLLNMTGNTGGTYTFSGPFNDSDSGDNDAGGLFFSGNTGGTTQFNNNVEIRTTNAPGLDINNNAAHAIRFAGTETLIDTDGILTVEITGGATVSFDSTTVNQITNDSGRGVVINGGGVVTLTGGIDVQTNSGGAALQMTGVTVGAGGIALGNVSSSLSTFGIQISNVAGGDITIAGGAITGISGGGIGVNLDALGSNFSYGGTITNPANTRSVQVTNSGGTSANTITFSGAISDSGSGIFLDNNDQNAGATINFTGGVTLNTGGVSAFRAFNGGTVNVTGANNTATSTTGTTVRIENTTIGGNGVTFQSVSADGAANGIVLSNTGAGAFTVTGIGSTAGSGGTIQNTTGAGILLSNAQNVSISNLNIRDTGSHGIQGITVTNLDLTNVTIDDAGNAVNEHGINIQNLLGTVSGGSNSVFTGVTVSDASGNGIFVRNSSATAPGNAANADSLSIIDSVIARSAVNGVLVENTIGGSGNLALTITGSTFDDNASSGIATNANAGILQATIGGGGAGLANDIGVASGTQNNGVSGGATTTGRLILDVIGNTITTNDDGLGAGGVGVASFDNAQITVTIQSNTITSLTPAVGGPGGTAVGGISVINEGSGSNTVLIDNNTITIVDGFGIIANAQGGGTGDIDFTITNNDISVTGVDIVNTSISVENTGSGGQSLCLNITGNTLATAPASNADVVLNNTNAGNVFQVQGLAATDSASPDLSPNSQPVEILINGNQTSSPSGTIVNPIESVGSFTVGTCSTP